MPKVGYGARVAVGRTVSLPASLGWHRAGQSSSAASSSLQRSMTRIFQEQLLLTLRGHCLKPQVPKYLAKSCLEWPPHREGGSPSSAATFSSYLLACNWHTSVMEGEHSSSHAPSARRRCLGKGDPAFSFTLPPPPGHLTELLHVTGEHLQRAQQQGGSDPPLIQPPEEKYLRGEGLEDLCEGGCLQNTHHIPCLCY